MKRTKFFKILAPIVALGLLIGALAGVSASANEAAPAADAVPEVISMNVEYGSELYLYYAVDKSTVAGTPALEVLSDASGSAVEYTVTEYTEEKVNGKACYIFKTRGVAAADIDKSQYVRAASGEVKGTIREASVEMYLYAKLYKEGFALKTDSDGDDFIRRNLYFQLLNYAKYAQELFHFGESYDAIGANGIIIEGAEGVKSGKITSSYIKLNAAPVEGKTFSYWRVEEFVTPFGTEVTEDARLLADGYECIILNSAKITPVYDAASMAGVEEWNEDALHFTESFPSIVSGNTGYIATDPEDARNNVLKVDLHSTTSSIVYSVSKSQIDPDANVAVMEFDLFYDGRNASGGSAHTTEVYFCDSDYSASGKAQKASFFYFSGSKLTPYKATSSSGHSGALSSVNSGIGYGCWTNIRVEYRVLVDEAGIKTPQFKFYVNDVLKITYEGLYATRYYELDDSGKTTTTLIQNNIPKVTDMNKIQYSVSSSIAAGSFCVDNVRIYHYAE